MLTVEDAKNIVWKDMPLLDMAEGNFQDVYFTLKLFDKFKEDLEKLGTWKLYSTCFSKMNNVCVPMEIDGMLVDEIALTECEIQLTTELDKAYKDLESVLEGYDVNIKSPKQMCAFFYTDEKGLQLYPPRRNKKTQAPSCDKQALELIEQYIEEAEYGIS